MGQCWFCGVETDQVVQCPQCKKSYCAQHAQPALHDCPGVPIVDIAPMPASSYVGPVNSTPAPLNASHVATYGPTQDEIDRSTQDGSYIWHGKADIPEDAFNPESGVEMPFVFWPKGSELAHFLIGGGLMFLFGFLTFYSLYSSLMATGGLYYVCNEIHTYYVNSILQTDCSIAPITIYQILVLAGIFMFSFFGHEFGHRQVARHYKMQTEFRLFKVGIILTLFSIGLAFFGQVIWHEALPGLGFPGAVVVIGLEKISRETGECKVAGPTFNLILGTILFTVSLIGWTAFPWNFVLYYAAFFNFQLGLFNMLPIGPLDGRNIIKWKPVVWVLLFIALAAFLGFIYWSLLAGGDYIFKIFLPNFPWNNIS